MEDDAPTQVESVDSYPSYSMRNLDDETIEILVEDKIATGG
jgi:hypothetical protein